MRIIVVLLLACSGWSADLLPQAPTGAIELQGTLAGERFWLRLNPPDARFGNQRMIELLYTPPAATALGGARLPDCPFLLVDERLRLVAWNGRDTLARVVAVARGYNVTREIDGPTIEGNTTAATPDERTVLGARGWDERLAPLLLAVAWRAGTTGEIPAYDFFGPTPPTPTTVGWQQSQVTIAGRPHQAVADPAGRLLRLDDASGSAVLTVSAWITP